MKLLNYLKETKGELANVKWPSRRISVLFTVLVILISVLTAYFLGFFDFIFSLGLRSLL